MTLLGLGRCRCATGCLHRALFPARTQVTNRRDLRIACVMVVCGTDSTISALQQAFMKNGPKKGLIRQATGLWLVSTRDELHTPSVSFCRQHMRQNGEVHDHMHQGLQDELNDGCTIIGHRPFLMKSLTVSKLGFGGCKLDRANSLRKERSECWSHPRFRGLVSDMK